MNVYKLSESGAANPNPSLPWEIQGWDPYCDHPIDHLNEFVAAVIPEKSDTVSLTRAPHRALFGEIIPTVTTLIVV